MQWSSSVTGTTSNGDSDGLYRVDKYDICAGFVVENGIVTQCAPVLRKRLAYWKTIAKKVEPAMNAILISDLHLTANPRDAYRWALFTWLAEVIPQYEIKDLFILGDVTEAKDFHSSRLVNRLVDAFLGLYRTTGLLHTHFLRGNHDGLDPECPFFRFLGKFPSISYITTPFMKQFSGVEVLMLPHTTDPANAWAGTDMHAADIIMMHATVAGAVAENGQALEGVSMSHLRRAVRATIYSGDVHVPQKVGRVEYIGAPYPIRFGDKFAPRALLLENMRTARSLPVPGIRRSTVTVAGPGADVASLVAEFKPGDQVKIKVSLTPAEFGDWNKVKASVVAACKAAQIDLCDLELERPETAAFARPQNAGKIEKQTPQQILKTYCTTNHIEAPLYNAGVRLLGAD